VITIDASVLVAAAMEEEAGAREVGAGEARDFLRDVSRSGLAIHEPALAMVEIAAGIARRTGRRDLVAEGLRLLAAMPGATFHPLDTPAAIVAATCATDLGVRVGDAIYAAVAKATGSTLVTFDRELLERASAIVETCTPGEWLARPRL
jgi:predicted nucleic acid-binding protein